MSRGIFDFSSFSYIFFVIFPKICDYRPNPPKHPHPRVPSLPSKLIGAGKFARSERIFELCTDLGSLSGILLLPCGDLACGDQFVQNLVDHSQQILIALGNADTVLLDFSYGSAVAVGQRECLETFVVVDDDFILAFLELNIDLVTIVCIYVYVYICVQILIYLSIAI